MIREDDVYRIGRIGKPHGTQGEMTMHVADDVFMRSECPYLALRVEGLLVPFFIEECRMRGAESALVCLEGIDTMEQAQAMTGCDVYFPRSEAEAAGGMSAATTVEGYAIVDADTGREIGRVKAIDDATANVLLITDQGQMIPAAPEIVTHVDHHSHTITVTLPDGLLEI